MNSLDRLRARIHNAKRSIREDLEVTELQFERIRYQSKLDVLRRVELMIEEIEGDELTDRSFPAA